MSDVSSCSAQLYCVCRSSDCSRFMIACDWCEEWYHGDCIGVTERQARHIKRFYCQLCRDKNSQLHIRYKHQRSGGDRSKNVSDAAAAARCHNCRACLRQTDCGKCSACRHHRRPCKRRVCHELRGRTSCSAAATEDKQAGRQSEASLGGELAATAPAENEEAARVTRPVSPPLSPAAAAAVRRVLAQEAASEKRRRRGGGNKRRSPASDDQLSQHDDDDDDDEQEEEGPGARRRDDSRDDLWQPDSSAARQAGVVASASKRRRVDSSAAESDDQYAARRHRGRRETRRTDTDSQVKQCCGPQCVHAARPSSRYCSDQCGLNLARNRIFQVLPQRIQEWNMTRCVAEEHNTRTLEHIRRQQQLAQTQLERLNRLHAQLDRVVERGRRLAIDPTSSAADEDIDDTTSLHCVTCGLEVSDRVAVRHMDKCYAKHESQTSFGSLYQTRVEGFNMFCDVYNRSTHTYCKRLRVLCPEHCKNPKIGDSESCGCPLLGKNFDPNGQVCRAPKKTCTKHLNWEKLRRAELDMERVRWAMKIDDLMEQERQCRQSMASRAGVLALMLHSTYDHDIMHKVQQQQLKMSQQNNNVKST